jgi:hypothetical protein
MNALQIFPNIIGLIALSGVVVKMGSGSIFPARRPFAS